MRVAYILTISSAFLSHDSSSWRWRQLSDIVRSTS